ncbi:MAG: sensor histidine kinase, partial [Flavobacteriaceae bacterium]|nr:sensor histidine kinase [Flavobacteriaceae bacterium]
MWNTYTFFQIFKEEERVKIELWAESLKTFNNADPTTDEIELPRLIMSNNKTIPIILTENGVIINQTNIDESIIANKEKLEQ